MALKVSWSPEAVRDVKLIAEYLSTDSAFFAKTVVAKLTSSARNLGMLPNIGKMVPGINDNALREIPVYSYRLVYRVETYQILIVAVVHGKR